MTIGASRLRVENNAPEGVSAAVQRDRNFSLRAKEKGQHDHQWR